MHYVPIWSQLENMNTAVKRYLADPDAYTERLLEPVKIDRSGRWFITV